MTSRPVFSILLPTMNQVLYLRDAVRAVLEQTFKDFELIISDAASQDETQVFAQAITDKRVKYVRQAHQISREENWNAAFQVASGQYVIVLSDRDYMLPRFLEEIHTTKIKNTDSDIFVVRHATYYEPEYQEKGLVNLLEIPKCSGTTETLESHYLLRELFGFNVWFQSSCICLARELLQEEAPFKFDYPMLYPLVQALGRSKVFTKVDKCLVAVGALSPNQQIEDGYSPGMQHENKELFPPISGPFFTNKLYWILASLKQDFPSVFMHYPIDLSRYFSDVLKEMLIGPASSHSATPSLRLFFEAYQTYHLQKKYQLMATAGLYRAWGLLPTAISEFLKLMWILIRGGKKLPTFIDRIGKSVRLIRGA